MFGITRIQRTLNYLKELEETKKVTDIKDIKNLKKLGEEFERVNYKLKILNTIRVIFFILLYSSIISAISSSLLIPGLKDVSERVVHLSTLIGSTVSLMIVVGTTQAISTYFGDITLISSRMIAILEKY